MSSEDRNIPGRLTNKVVAVTGAANGIGAAIASRCAVEGASLVIVDRDKEGLGRCKDQIAELVGDDSRVCVVAGDVTIEETIEAMLVAAVDKYGGLYGLVNNAGIFGRYARFEENDDEAFEQMVATNVRPIWRAIKRAKPLMLEAGGASIVNVASMAAMRANRRLSL